MPLPTEPKDPEDKGRKAKEVSDDLLDDGQAKDDPADKHVPDPTKKTPNEMNENPADKLEPEHRQDDTKPL